MHCYTRNTDGTLDKAPLVILDDGEISLGRNYNPVTLTYVGPDKLMGWGRDDGESAIYKTESGREIIVPERYRKRVETTVNKA